MKKVLLVMLVALIALTSAFAGFDKSKFNINVGQMYFGQYGVSYDFTDKLEVGANYLTNASIPFGVYVAITYGPEGLLDLVYPAGGEVFAEYKVAEFKHSDLKLGAAAGYYFYGFDIMPNAIYSYHINEHNSVFAKVSFPVIYAIKGEDFVNALELNMFFGAIGYTYSF